MKNSIKNSNKAFQNQKNDLNENNTSITKAINKEAYKVFDEMAMEILLVTNDFNKANNLAYNHQCVLLDNHTNKVLHDYSCDW